jgi:hypothetical protein
MNTGSITVGVKLDYAPLLRQIFGSMLATMTPEEVDRAIQDALVGRIGYVPPLFPSYKDVNAAQPGETE